MHPKDAHLYRPAKTSISKPSEGPPASSTGGLTFASDFSSLIAASAPKNGESKPRVVTKKNDFFATHNRGAKKRAAADMFAHSQEVKKDANNDELDEVSWRRTKRKMDEKARLYAALKRGDVDDTYDRYDVDFDRKWTERGGKEDSDQEDSEDGEESDGDVQVEYVDELGRTRTGSRRDAERERTRVARQRRKEEAFEQSRGVPVAPEGVIYGDTIQTEAFDLDGDRFVKMEDLAEKRDRPVTPPPDTHYDASQEIRTKGTGFYQFSQDKEKREQQMRELDELRAETEKARTADKRRKEEAEQLHQKEEEEKRAKLVREERSKAMADDFLNKLGEEMQAGATESTTQSREKEDAGG